MNIHIATDHAGYDLKEHLKSFLQTQGHSVTDHGAFAFDADDDYPDFVIPCAQAVGEDAESVGIVIGGSGQGEAIAANKISGIRAGVYYGGDLELVKLVRQHNNANILSLGARFITTDQAENAVTLFLETAFSNGERHVRRIEKLES
jgi:ribose 5-phosphate isomerase B